MLGIGITEILLVAAVALLVVGPERLPKVLRQVGRWYGQARRAADDLRRAFVLEADRQDAADRYAKLQERRRKAQEARKAAAEAEPEPAGDEAGPDEDEAPEGGVAPFGGAQAPVAQERPILTDAEEASLAHSDEEEDGHPPPDPNADPPDAPHPTRPTPLSGEFP